MEQYQIGLENGEKWVGKRENLAYTGGKRDKEKEKKVAIDPSPAKGGWQKKTPEMETRTNGENELSDREKSLTRREKSMPENREEECFLLCNVYVVTTFSKSSSKLFHAISNGNFQSVPHRVLANYIGTRISIGCFSKRTD